MTHEEFRFYTILAGELTGAMIKAKIRIRKQLEVE